jgi:ubiquinone/menaquinone biosynthesis C-methylase UbiE
LEHSSPDLVAGIEPSKGFLLTAKKNLDDRFVLIQGSATQIPLADTSIDVVVSGFLSGNGINIQSLLTCDRCRNHCNDGISK